MQLSLIISIIIVITPRVLGEDDPSGSGRKNEVATPALPSIIKVTTLQDEPYSGVLKVNGTLVGTGYAFYLLDLIKQKLNFTYTIVLPDQQVLGDEKTGVLGLLYKKEVDLAVAFIPKLLEMRKYCSFGGTMDESLLTVFMKRPPGSATGTGLLAPFHPNLWLCVLISLIVIGPIIYVCDWIRVKLWKDKSEKYDFDTCVWFSYSALVKQGTSMNPSADSTRILFATWWIFITVLSAFYTANLTAFLTKPQFTLGIHSLKDLVGSGHRWTVLPGRTMDFLLTHSNGVDVELLKTPRGQKYQQQMNIQGPTKEDILKTIEKDVLFIGDGHLMETILFEDYLNKTHRLMEHSKRCTYVIMPGSFFNKNRAFAYPHNSTIKKYIDDYLLKLVESGVVNHLKNVDLPMAEVCPVDLHTIERQLSNSDLSLTYQVVIAGYGLGGIFFCVELLLKLLKVIVKKYQTRQEEINVHLKNQLSNDCCCSFWPRRKNTLKPEPINDRSPPLYDTNENFPRVDKRSPPPLYQHLEHDMKLPHFAKKQCINGRDYYIVMERNGDQRLIPIRTPSAFLFHYAT